MERVLVDTPVTISQQWQEDGVNADPGVVTIGVTRANGTVAIASGTATSGSGTNPRSFTLSAAVTAELDWLDATWTSPSKGTLTERVEVVGGFFYSIAEGIAAGMTLAEVPDKRTAAEESLEGDCHVAFVPRYALEQVSGDWSRELMLGWPLIRTIRSVSVDGTAYSAGQIADLGLTVTGIHSDGGWPRGFRNIVVGYEHGYDRPPANADRAALGLAMRSVPDPQMAGQVIEAQAGEERTRYHDPTESGGYGILEVDDFVEKNTFPVVG